MNNRGDITIWKIKTVIAFRVGVEPMKEGKMGVVWLDVPLSMIQVSGEEETSDLKKRELPARFTVDDQFSLAFNSGNS